MVGKGVLSNNRVSLISRQMTMLLMYLSNQTVPKYDIEDNSTKNKLNPVLKI